MAEALITLPVFVAALAGLVALNGIYGAKLEAKARARRMAWLQADSGECPVRTCQTGECGRIEGDIRAGGLDDLLSVGDSHFSLASFLGHVGQYLLGKATNGVGLSQALIPTIVGSGRTSQSGVATLLCNTTARSADDGGNVLEQACRTGLETMEYAREICR